LLNFPKFIDYLKWLTAHHNLGPSQSADKKTFSKIKQFTCCEDTLCLLLMPFSLLNSIKSSHFYKKLEQGSS